LRRQAKKAERYRQVKGELRDLELHAASLEILRLAVVERVQLGERQQLETRLGDGLRGLETDEIQLESDRLRLIEEEQRLLHEQQASSQLDARLSVLERDLAHWREQREEAKVRAQIAAQQAEEAKERIASADVERRDIDANVREMQDLSQQDQQQLDRAQEAVVQEQQAMLEIDKALDIRRRDALEFVQQRAQQRTLLSNLERQKMDVQRRLEHAEAEQGALAEESQQSQQKQAQVQVNCQTLENDLRDWSERMAAMRQQLAQVKLDANASEAEVMALRQETSDRRSRLESLEEIARRFEGYSDGVRSLMGVEVGDDGDETLEQKSCGMPVVSGIRGLVTDIVNVEPRYERAIESALGEKLQFLVVEGHRTGMEAI
ncbi:MAG: hypothetical protein KDA51_14725, partial [Planctomycetales bacterium]|nr:hypothetical protein [Planctomycetales bacterium]